MRFVIAVFAVLIIGSNASLLGNLASLAGSAVDAATITAQANGILSTFQGQVNLATSDAIQNIKQQVQTVAGALQTILNNVLTIAQGTNTQIQLSVSDAANVAAQVASALASLNQKTVDTIAKATAAANALPLQIATAVGPSIVALNNKILSGLKPTCFTNEVPAINQKIAVVVNNTKNGFEAAIGQTFTTVNNDVTAVQNIANGLQNVIQTQTFSVVSFQLYKYFCFDVTSFFFST